MSGIITGEIQTLLCLAFGSEDITYTGTLSGDVYKWQGHNLVASVQGAHLVHNGYTCCWLAFQPVVLL